MVTRFEEILGIAARVCVYFSEIMYSVVPVMLNAARKRGRNQSGTTGLEVGRTTKRSIAAVVRRRNPTSKVQSTTKNKQECTTVTVQLLDPQGRYGGYVNICSTSPLNVTRDKGAADTQPVAILMQVVSSRTLGIHLQLPQSE